MPTYADAACHFPAIACPPVPRQQERGYGGGGGGELPLHQKRRQRETSRFELWRPRCRPHALTGVRRPLPNHPRLTQCAPLLRRRRLPGNCAGLLNFFFLFEKKNLSMCNNSRELDMSPPPNLLMPCTHTRKKNRCTNRC
jgi:hypothetical protein